MLRLCPLIIGVSVSATQPSTAHKALLFNQRFVLSYESISERFLLLFFFELKEEEMSFCAENQLRTEYLNAEFRK